MLDGILDQPRASLDSKHVHDPVLVKSDGPRLELEYEGDLLHRLAFGKELENFALPSGDAFFFVVYSARAQEEFDRIAGDKRRKVGIATEHAPNGLNQLLGAAVL